MFLDSRLHGNDVLLKCRHSARLVEYIFVKNRYETSMRNLKHESLHNVEKIKQNFKVNSMYNPAFTGMKN